MRRVMLVGAGAVARHQLVAAAMATARPVPCEKPLALSVEQAQDLARPATGHGAALGCADMRFRGLATTQEVRRLVRSGELGDLYHVSFVRRRARSGFDFRPESGRFSDPELSGGGVTMDWGPYDIAVLDGVLQPRSVEVRSAWFGTPATGGPHGGESARSEQHVGAHLRLDLGDGRLAEAGYERAACTHGTERADLRNRAFSTLRPRGRRRGPSTPVSTPMTRVTDAVQAEPHSGRPVAVAAAHGLKGTRDRRACEVFPCAARYSAGVMPLSFLNSLLRWLWS